MKVAVASATYTPCDHEEGATSPELLDMPRHPNFVEVIYLYTFVYIFTFVHTK